MQLARGEHTAHFAFGWQGMEPTPAASLSDAAQGAADAACCLDPATNAAVAEAAARRLQEAENAAIHLIRLLVDCAQSIQAGDYAAAAGKLAEAREVLATAASTAPGISRIASHFAAALAQRLFPASPHSSFALDASPEHAGELYGQFYDAGPYLKFAHFAANQAILEAFQDCDHVHVVDLAIMDGVQWPALIQALSIRPGGPPSVRITGFGSAPAADEVGLRLAELVRAVNVPFSFQSVPCDSLGTLQPWMFRVLDGEAVAVNSVLQLHRLLVDPDAASTSFPTPIDVVLGWIAAMRPKVVTVVEQEADHNRPGLMARFNNALFYYGILRLLDSMEMEAAMSARHGGSMSITAGADAYVQREIFDIVCGEGSARSERHEPLACWCARIWRTGLTHVPLDTRAAKQAAMVVRVFSGPGFSVQLIGGCLSLAWHERPLFTASVWSARPAIAGEHVDKAVITTGQGSHYHYHWTSRGARPCPLITAQGTEL